MFYQTSSRDLAVLSIPSLQNTSADLRIGVALFTIAPFWQLQIRNSSPGNFWSFHAVVLGS